MGGLLQYWNLSGRHQLFGLQSPSQGCSVGSGISSSDRSISNCIYFGYSICNVQVSQKEKRSWGVSDLLTSCPSIALVIDLTNTYRLFIFFFPLSCYLLRYYSPKELESKGVKHVKILTEGKVVPSEGVVQQFYRWPVNILSQIGKHVFSQLKPWKTLE